ncbi:hypothetical protein [Shewanella xiamenensis]|uniref:hypothetical protein n=1 Tax=Shewanella xiamenensis TaxID=332186 RepID=UPI000849B0BC|nr:hypothetical protein [Shewanella xiamenensis]ODR86716.1 hypothetical protein ABT47_16095 [Shewanella xiamenensis]
MQNNAWDEGNQDQKSTTVSKLFWLSLVIISFMLWTRDDKSPEVNAPKAHVKFEQNMQARGYDIPLVLNEKGNYEWTNGGTTFWYTPSNGSFSFMTSKGSDKIENVVAKIVALGTCYNVFLAALNLGDDSSLELEAISNELLYSAWDSNGTKQANYQGAQLLATSFSTNPPIYKCTITP